MKYHVSQSSHLSNLNHPFRWFPVMVVNMVMVILESRLKNKQIELIKNIVGIKSTLTYSEFLAEKVDTECESVVCMSK